MTYLKQYAQRVLLNLKFFEFLKKIKSTFELRNKIYSISVFCSTLWYKTKCYLIKISCFKNTWTDRLPYDHTANIHDHLGTRGHVVWLNKYCVWHIYLIDKMIELNTLFVLHGLQQAFSFLNVMTWKKYNIQAKFIQVKFKALVKFIKKCSCRIIRKEGKIFKNSIYSVRSLYQSCPWTRPASRNMHALEYASLLRRL